jgi:tritrans,polycis-undecaprenyl-diphosphate synthase [geranylgeranyl-diphosphate specific]
MGATRIPVHRIPGVSRLLAIARGYYEQQLLYDVLRVGVIPKHIAIILDGNRRYAGRAGLDPSESYMLGAKKLEEVLEWCQELGIKHITVYAFSTENFNRSEEEVRLLMDLFRRKFSEAARDPRVHRYRIRVRAIGELERLPEGVKRAISEAEEATKDYDGHTLNLAVGYGGRTALAQAVRRICERIERGELRPNDVDEELISKHLYTADLPDPDLIIRTSGEERLSGFLLWQSAYSELYFCEANWPEFTKLDFLRAIRTYQGRERRFGR